MKALEQDQFLHYRFLSNIQCGKKEGTAAFVSSTANEENGYDHHIYFVEGETVRQLTNGSESSYIFDDERTILFTSMRDKRDQEAAASGEERTAFYRISVDGGEAVKVFSVPLTVTKFCRVKEGKYLLLVRYDLAYSKMYAMKEEEKQVLLRQKKEEADYQIVTETPFRFDGAGWTNGLRNRLFLYDEKTGALEPLTKEETFEVSTFELSADTDRVLIVGDHFDQVKPDKPGVYELTLSTGEMTELIPENTWTLGPVCYYGEGVLVAATKGEIHGTNENPDFYYYNSATGEMNFLGHNEYTLHTGIMTDVTLLGGKNSLVADDIFYTGIIRGFEGPVMRLAADGTLSDVVSLSGNVCEFDVKGNFLYYIAMEDRKLTELYRLDLSTGERTQLTHMNEEVLAESYVADPVYVPFVNDGVQMDGWVLFPKDYQPGTKYPGILDIHGGPCAAYGEIFSHEMQLFANNGYFVFFCNPRGSDGKGEAFADIRGRLGTIDYDDFMRFTDTVLAKFPDIDESRLGVTGGSYGGYMTNWIITHTDRFRCAVSERSISNWVAENAYSDIGYSMGNDVVQGMPYGDVKQVWDQSPLQFADKCHTPTLFLHSTEDFRCPLPEGIAMYTEIANAHVPSRMCIFKGESHGLSRSGKPKHRVKRFSEMMQWMDKYLK